MKKNVITLCLVAISSLAYSQVGINTPNPQGALHVDGAKDNPATGTPNAAQQANDVVATATGSLGVGTMPLAKFHVEGAESLFTNGTSRWALDPEGATPSSRLSIVDRASDIRRLILSENGDAYIGGSLGSAGETAIIRSVGGNVGIRTLAGSTPGTALDVTGAITNRETAVAVAGNAAAVPSNVSQIRLTGAATASVTVNAPAAPNAGQRLIVYNDTTGGFDATLNGVTIANGQALEFAYSNGGWRSTNGGAGAPNTVWNVLGNAGTTPATNFLGTTDNQDMVVRTNNTEKMRVQVGGNVGIGTDSPSTKLHIAATAANSNRFTLIDAPSGTNQLAIMALRNTSPLATGNYSLLGFTNNGPTGGGAAWGIGSIRTSTAEEFFIGNSLGGGYNERFRITSAGSIGIATPTPGSKLGIVGNFALGTNYATVAAPTNGAIIEGAVGIGTTNGTLAKVRVVSENNDVLNEFHIDDYSGTTNMYNAIRIHKARGSETTPANLANGDYIGALEFNPRFNNSPNTYTNGSGIQAVYEGSGTDNLTSLRFFTSGQMPTSGERMRIADNGNVGIGTTSPLAALHVNGTESRFSNGTSAWALTPSLGGPTGASNSLEVVDRVNNVRRMIFHDNGDISMGGGINTNTVAGALSIRGDVVSIGWRNTNPVTTYRLNVNGDINAVGSVRANGIALTSDARLKKDIVSLSYGLNTVMALRPVEYEKKSSIEANDYNHHEIGLIAQEVAKVIPSIVTVGADGDKTLAVSYTEFIPVLIKAIQEQQQEIEQLKSINKKLVAAVNENAELQKNYAELKQQVKDMQQMMGMKKAITNAKIVSK